MNFVGVFIVRGGRCDASAPHGAALQFALLRSGRNSESRQLEPVQGDGRTHDGFQGDADRTCVLLHDVVDLFEKPRVLDCTGDAVEIVEIPVLASIVDLTLELDSSTQHSRFTIRDVTVFRLPHLTNDLFEQDSVIE